MTTNFPINLGTFSMYRGDAQGRNKVTVTLTDSNNVPVDMSSFGSTWKAQARYADILLNLVLDTSGIASGVIVASVADADSATLPPFMDFDIQVAGGTISPLTLFSGRFTAAGEVTV